MKLNAVTVMHTTTFLAFLLLQIRSAKTCSFIRISGEVMVAVKFKIGVQSQDICLATCFDELDCTFVDYFERNCTVYTDGNSSMMSNGTLLKFERDVPRPECESSIEFGIPVEFQPFAVSHEENVTCSGIPTNNTVISAFIDSNGYRFYAKQEENFFSGMGRGVVMTFAREPQPQCTSVPVFTRAGRRRLFFGSVYNTTGYTFMEAYAFTSKCACDNACCGGQEIREKFFRNKTYVYGDITCPVTLVNQNFFIASRK